MIAALVPLILQASLQALFAAAAVWFGLRVLRVANVLVQKAAWGLVLVAALALPMAPHWQPLPTWATFRLPVSALDPLPASTPASNSAAAPAATPAPGPTELSSPRFQGSATTQPASPTATETDSGRYPAQSRPSDHYVAPAGYDVSSISRVNLNAPVWSAPPANSVTEEEPSSTPVSESRPEVKGTGFSPVSESRPEVKGTDFRPASESRSGLKGTGLSPTSESQSGLKGTGFRPASESQSGLKGTGFRPGLRIPAWTEGYGLQPVHEPSKKIAGFSPRGIARSTAIDSEFERNSS